MVDAETVRRLAMALPQVEDKSEGEWLVFEVTGGSGLAWGYKGRAQPKKPRVLHPDVLAVRCQVVKKEMLVEAAPDRFFDDDHYRGFPAVMVRLAAIGEDELAAMLQGAWELSQPKPKSTRKRSR